MEDETENCATPRKGVETSEPGRVIFNDGFQSPLVITTPDGRASTKTRSLLRLEPVSCKSGNDRGKIKQQLLSRGFQAESLFSSRGFSLGSESPMSTIGKPGFGLAQFFSTPKRISRGGLSPIDGERTPLRVPGSMGGVMGGGFQTPASQRRARPPMSGRKMKLQASLQLRLLESQELQASRIAKAKWELWMDRQERAYAAWLNHLLKQPMSPNSGILTVGMDAATVEASTRSLTGSHGDPSVSTSLAFASLSVEHESTSRGRCAIKAFPGGSQTPHPHTHKKRGTSAKGHLASISTCRRQKDNQDSIILGHTPENHISHICSASELQGRLNVHLEPSKSDEIVSTMMQLAKHIDDGRVRMKANCAILTDVALRQKAMEVLLNYNPSWLRLGLVVVLGCAALLGKDKLPTSDHCGGVSKGSQSSEYALLEVLLERNFLADVHLAKFYASNRSIGGLYGNGYGEALGKVILKRFFLLVLVLDKIKSQTALHSSHGIDGLDGGSPLLFRPNTSVKSSRQALEDFLSDAMQGEGDLIGHLRKLGYHVSHIQTPLCEYNFEVNSLVEDLQDGIRLCRLAQLMSEDLSVLAKMKWPCHVRKTRVHNCKVALQSLAHAGVPLQDEKGASITADHIVDGCRDKTLPLLWSIILHLQIPRLVNPSKLWQEIVQVQGSPGSLALGPCLEIGGGEAVLDLLLAWAQAVCSSYGGVMVENFDSSFADAQALCYIVNFYLPLYLPRHAILPTRMPVSNYMELLGRGRREICKLFPRPFPPRIKCLHCVFRKSKIVDSMGAGMGKSLQMRETMTPADREAIAHNFQMLQEVAKMLGRIPEVLELADLVDGDSRTCERNVIMYVAHLCSALFGTKSNIDLIPMNPFEQALHNHRRQEDNAAMFIQARYRGWVQRRMFQSTLVHVRTLQGWWRACQLRKHFLLQRRAAQKIQQHWRGALAWKMFVRLRNSVLRIQASWRGHHVRLILSKWRAAAIVIQSCCRGFIHRRAYNEYRNSIARFQAIARGKRVRQRVMVCRAAVIHIQARWRGYCVRQSLAREIRSVLCIQSWYRSHIQREKYKKCRSAITKLQAFVRGIIVRQRLHRQHEAASAIQALFRGWLAKQEASKSAMIMTQSFRASAACTIQTHWSEYETTKRPLALVAKEETEEQCEDKETVNSVLDASFSKRVYNAVELEAGQRLSKWAKAQIHRITFLRLRRFAIVLQRHIRGWQARKSFAHAIRCVYIIQAHWRGYEQRRGQGYINAQMQQLRGRIHSTAATVENSQRLCNRLTEALAQLLNQKTVSGILNTCATIDVATEHSKQCCQRLAEGGAITKLLQLIQTTNRSPPHEQVVKHALSILANLARFSDLALCILEASGSINIIVEQLLMFRSREEVFAKAIKVLQLVCSNPSGTPVIQRTPRWLRSLEHVVKTLERKLEVEKRNVEKFPHSTQSVLRKAAERKLRETALHYHTITSILPGSIPGIRRPMTSARPAAMRPDPSAKALSASSSCGVSVATRPRVALQDKSNRDPCMYKVGREIARAR